MTISTAAPSKIYRKYHRRVQGLHVESSKSIDILRRGCGEQQASILPDLEHDVKDWQQELEDSRLIFLGQTGLGKTTTLEILLILTTQAYAKVSDRMKSEAVLAALKGRTWDAATQEEVEYVEPQIELSGDDPNLEAIQKSHQAYLECSSKGASAGPPKQLLSRTGNPVGSTTSSNTLFRFGKTLGAVEKFKSRDDLQHLAHDCLVRLAVLQLGQSTRQLQEINQLKQRFHAITGQAADTANYATPSAVVLSEEVQKVAGTVRLYSGHGQPFSGYRDWLSGVLTQNQLESPVLIALDHTQIFYPSEILKVPTGDTVGTGDANPLNADMTQQAVDEAIHTSSQLVLFAAKSLRTEDTLTPYLIDYCKHMLTTDSSRPAIHCVLMPGTHKSPYTPADLQRPEQQVVDKQREEQSIAQFRECLHMVNMSLESDQQASQEQLEQIVQERFTVHVVYLRTLAALCQMPAAMLEEFAYLENLNTEELLESTNGLWLLGLSRQLTAELSQRFMRRLDSVHLQQIINTAEGEMGDNSAARLPSRVALRLAEHTKQQWAGLRMRGDSAPDLSDLQHKVEQVLSDLQGRVDGAFGDFVASCQQHYDGRRPSILEDWKAKFAGATPSDQRTMVVYRTEGGLSRTTAFKQTFGKITLPTGWSQQLQAKLQPVMKECFEVQILRLLEEQTVSLLAASAPGQDIRPLVQQAAHSRLQATLAGAAEKLTHQLLKESSVKACLRQMHVEAAKDHLITGPFSSESFEGCQQEIRARVTATLDAAAQEVSSTLKAHVGIQIKTLSASLFRDSEMRYRGRVLLWLLEVVDQVNALTRRADLTPEDQQRRNKSMKESMKEIKKKALDLRDQIRKDTNLMMQTATVPDRKGGGLASAVHRRARLNSWLEQLLTSAGDWPQIQRPARPELAKHPRLCKDIGQAVWGDISGDPIPLSIGSTVPGMLSAGPSNPALLDLGTALPGYALPTLTDSEWAAFSLASLPATVQKLLWPGQQADDGAKWLKAGMAYQLEQDWDAMQALPTLKEVRLLADDGKPLGLEDYVQQIMTGKHLGVLELIMLMRILQAAGQAELTVVFQIWQADSSAPVQLFYGPENVEAMTFNVFLAILPQSKKPVWLPLIKENASSSNVPGSSMSWSDRLEALDAKIVRKQASSDVKQAPQRPAFCRKRGPTAVRTPVTRNMAAQSAESAGSSFHRTKRCGEHVSGKGKVPRTE